MLFLVFRVEPMVEDHLKQRPFDAAAWRQSKDGPRSDARVWMVDDFLAHHSPVGRPVAEIDTLLGPDDIAPGATRGRGNWKDCDRLWCLGHERGFISIDAEWLVLRVDASGTVTEAKLYRD